jgi:site-specific DNA recombinase
MGRLTLNMLLSFAQFEREIAGERIRDKIAASKKKGMWMGGNVPLGYDVAVYLGNVRLREPLARLVCDVMRLAVGAHS